MTEVSTHEPEAADVIDDEASEALAVFLAESAMDKKAVDPVVIDVRGKASYADYLVLCSGRNDRHVVAIADALDEAAAPYRKVYGREGLAGGQWVLIDFGDVIAHVFYGPARSTYSLDALWSDARRVDIEVPDELRGDESLYSGYEIS